MSEMMVKLIIFIITLLLTLGANLAVQHPDYLRYLKIAIIFLNGLLALVFIQAIVEFEPTTPSIAGIIILGGTLVMATALLFERCRQLLPISGTGYNPSSPVHMLVLILGVYFFGLQFADFALHNGLSGIAQNMDLGWGTLAADALPQWIIPFIGVGLLTRRSWAETRQRLGLVDLNGNTVQIGIMTSIVLFFGVAVLTALWQSLVSPETYAEQTQATQTLVQSVNSVGLVVAFALFTAVGEELIFRGALQPIFGFWVATIGFVVIHVQYTLTPAMLIIFWVGIVLAWVRTRSNLYTVIIAHFLYNLSGLLLALR